MNFIGNQKSLKFLTNSLNSGKVSHAYLFCGPEKVGKFILAKKFATSLIKKDKLDLNIENFTKDALLDLIIVEPEIVEKNGIKKQRDISIEVIRNAKNSLSLYPYHGAYKILIINDAHKMNVAAQNALLKILEEPNPTTIIILVTHEPEKILSTIFSRVQQINFGLATQNELEANFLPEVISYALGRPGYAKLLAENGAEKEFAIESIEQLNKALGGSVNEKINLAEKLSKDAVQIIEKSNLWLWQLRKTALTFEGSQRQKIFGQIEKINDSMEIIKNTNSNSRLILETLFLDL